MTSNGSSDEVVAQAAAPDHPASDATTTRDSIQQTKDKAKAVMAASGIEIASDASKADETSPSLHSDERAVNGESPSRKRSRSGSRMPKVPRADKLGIVPIESDTDKYRFLSFVEHDQDYAGQLIQHNLLNTELIDSKNREESYWSQVGQLRKINPAQVFGTGYQGFGNGFTELYGRTLRGPFPPVLPAIMYPDDRVPEKNWLPHKKQTRRRYVPRADVKDQAELAEELVPIRLDIEHDKVKLRDTFTMNLHDYITDTELFATQLVEDFNVPQASFVYIRNQVIHKITEQLQEFYPHIYIDDPPLDETLPYFAYKNDEMRVLVKLNITIASHTLIDQFEWEINNPLNNPEEFALVMVKELSLSGEFATAIAHQIREQSQLFTKSLYITAHPFDGRPIEDADVRDAFLPTPVNSVFRPVQSSKDYAPYLYMLNDSDLQREELSILRDQRRQKRSVGRRGGPALPDLKDRERTIRTMVVSSVLPGAAETLETARLFKLSRTSGRGRRPGTRIDGGEYVTDEDESDESDMEMEVIQPIVSSSRGRIIRGAATAAQAAMKANYTQGRPATPEVATLHHEESRGSVRRGRFEVTEESESEEEPEEKLMVTLKLPKEILRQLARGMRIYRKPDSQAKSRTATPTRNIPGSPAKSIKDGHTWVYHEDGRVDANPNKTGQIVSCLCHLCK
jgi:SWI/SNF-related matrix-associated actin-dependent regulator of chromatin subfamily B protein 1